MDMRLVQRQELALKMAPQIIQSIEILQLPMLDLRDRVDQELADNPVLEISQEKDEGDQSTDQVGDEQAEPVEETTVEETAVEETAVEETAADEALDEAIEAAFDDEDRWRSQLKGGRSRAALNELSDKKREAMENALAVTVTLEEHLLNEVRLAECGENVRLIAEHIISNLDEGGYLQHSLEDVLESIKRDDLTMEDAQEALALVQSLDPPGVGARTLVECLLLQFTDAVSDYDFKRAMIEHHLEDIGKNRLPKIVKETGRSIEDVKDVIEFIAHLDPTPGRVFSTRPIPYVIPDVIVENIDGRYEVRLEESEIPPLYISRAYRNLIQQRSTDPKTRAYLRKKIQAARWLIESIEQRRSTLYRVATSIVEAQEVFFEEGPLALSSLKMQDIATKVGVHVSTVGRAIKDKYMQCPIGVFPMKYFFTGGTKSDDGQDQSYKSIKVMIQRMIGDEEKAKPMSDKDIADRLAARGITVKRRTVAKYREVMGIPSSRERRQY